MSKRIVIGQKPLPLLFPKMQKDWPYTPVNPLVVDGSSILRNNPQRVTDIRELVGGMQNRAKYGEEIIAAYRDYLLTAYKSTSRSGNFYEFINRCSNACGALLFPVLAASNNQVWITAPVVDKHTRVPGREFYQAWRTRNPLKQGETTVTHYSAFCTWAQQHAEMVSEMLRHKAIVFI